MDRRGYAKYRPPLPHRVALVDQYLWPVKDTNNYTAVNGTAQPIYDCDGSVSYTLPLDKYPNWYQVDPQIRQSQMMLRPYAQGARYFKPDAAKCNMYTCGNL